MTEINPPVLQAADYYAEVSHTNTLVTSQFCKPYTLFEETSPHEGIKIHSFRSMPVYSRFVQPIQEYSDRLLNFLSDASSAIHEQPPFKHGMSYHERDYHFDQKIVNPKIKTGRIAALAISAVSPDQMPMTMPMSKKAKDAIEVEAPYVSHIDEAYFIIAGIAVIGGRLGTLGCGIRSTAVVYENHSGGPYAQRHPWSRSVHMNYKRFPDKLLTSVMSWDAARSTARSVEALNRLTAYGGLHD